MQAHLVQLETTWHDPTSNFASVRRLIGGAGVRPGDLIVLPEMFDTGFSWDIKVTVDRGATLEFLESLAREYKSCVIGGRTIAGEAPGKGLNVATAVGPDGAVLGEFAKMHLFPIGEETRHMQAGTSMMTFRWPPRDGLIVCPAICYDLRFPEQFRAGLRLGAELFVVPACWLEGRHAHWRALLIARAIENQAFVLGVNRTGRDPNARYLGGSIAVSPRGDVIGELGEPEGVLSVSIDATELRAWREKFPAWRDAGA